MRRCVAASTVGTCGLVLSSVSLDMAGLGTGCGAPSTKVPRVAPRTQHLGEGEGEGPEGEG